MKPLALIAAILLLTGIGHSEPEEMTASRDVIEDFVAAYNAKDLDGMMALAHPDIEWIAVDGSESEVFSAGTAALAEEMTGHFASATFPHSELSNWSVNEDFVAVTETARWTGADGEEKAQSSIAVYQLDEGLIRRVWYYPSRQDLRRPPEYRMVRQKMRNASMIRLAAVTTALMLGAAATAQTAPPSEVMKLYDIAEAPSADRIYADIEKLVSFGTRHTASETESDTRGIGAARRWIFAEFEKISDECGGCLEVIYVGDTVSGETRIPDPVEVVSVLAIQRGKRDPNRMVMMSGDIDSRVTDAMNATSDSPGANDNASGMAGTIEAARILSKYEFDGTIIYAGLAGEEQGLFGGKIVAQHALDEGWQIKAVLNNDMISNISGIDGVTDNTVARVFSEGTRAVETPEEARARRFTGGEVDSPSRNLARYIDRMADQYLTNLDVMMIYRLDRFGRGGHHRPFNAVGIPGVRIMETHEHYDRQHQDLRTEDGREYGDTLDGVDAGYAAKLTALNMVTLAGIADAPPFPANVKAEGAVQPSAKLTWEHGGDKKAMKNLAGYRVYWRETTAPQWTNSRFVGNVTEWEFTNLVIDNYYFGVSAVAKDGSETPVVFPGAAGAF